MLKDVIGLGLYCIQVIQRRKALRFASISFRCWRVELFLVWSRSRGHVMYLLSAVAYLMKAIIQTAVVERNQRVGDASVTDRVSGVVTLNEIY
jgi:hypothetical protein